MTERLASQLKPNYPLKILVKDDTIFQEYNLHQHTFSLPASSVNQAGIPEL